MCNKARVTKPFVIMGGNIVDTRYEVMRVIVITMNALEEVLQEILFDRSIQLYRQDYICVEGWSEGRRIKISSQEIMDALSVHLGVNIIKHYVDENMGVWFMAKGE